MKPIERFLVIFFGTALAMITLLIFVTLLVYEEPQGYTPPCRGPGHIELPREKCEADTESSDE